MQKNQIVCISGDFVSAESIAEKYSRATRRANKGYILRSTFNRVIIAANMKRNFVAVLTLLGLASLSPVVLAAKWRKFAHLSAESPPQSQQLTLSIH